MPFKVNTNRKLLSPLGKYQFNVREDTKPGSEIGILGVADRDEIQNKDPTFNLQQTYNDMFDIRRNNEKDGILFLQNVSIGRFKTVTCYYPHFQFLSKAYFPLESITASGLRKKKDIQLLCICGRAHRFKISG